MHNFNAIYGRILEVLRKFSSDRLLTHQPVKPKLSDLEVIALSFTMEYLGIDSESDFFRKLPAEIADKIDRSVFNRRRRGLSFHVEKTRRKLAGTLNNFEDIFILDSMPLEVCKLARSSRSNICKEEVYSSPNKGYCAAQSMSYYGYKLHAICSAKGVFHSFDISPASVHDIHYLKDVRSQLSNCTLLGDKGYLSSTIQLDLFNTCKINLQTPMRKNQLNYKPQPFLFRKSRKRIETLFSQLCDQFMIRRNYAKSFDGFKTRILSKISALTVIQYINKFYFDRNINNIKTNII